MEKSNPISRREILQTTASLVLGNGLLRAQNPTFSVNVEWVLVFATVRDKKGKIVKELGKDDFMIREDGRVQPILSFSQESDLPMTLGLIVDTTPSESNMMDEEKAASRAFLNKMLRPETDKAFLIQYYNEIELLQDLTSSREKLEAALKLLRRHEAGGRGAGTLGGGTGRGTGTPGGSAGSYDTALSDAVYLASDEIMKSQKGRKALFILGDGDHIGDRSREAIEAAHRADTLVYSIRIYDRNFGGNGGGALARIPGILIPGGGRGEPPQGRGPSGPNQNDGKKGLEEMSKETGGAYFEATSKGALDKIFAQIEEELRSQYCIAYAPDSKASGGFRKIVLETRNKNLVVRCREGYYPQAGAQSGK